MTSGKRKQPTTPTAPTEVYVIVRDDGELVGPYPAREDAAADQWGPLFRGSIIAKYTLTPEPV
jgi:hypothetical protein